MNLMKAFIVNRREHREGKETGRYFPLPVDPDYVNEELHIKENDGYYILDYDLPFEIEEEITLEELNRLCRMVIELEPYMQDDLNVLLDYGYSLEQVYDEKDNIEFYEAYDNMEELAYDLVTHYRIFGELSDRVEKYFDYAAFGRDLERSGKYVIGRHGIYSMP